MDNVYNINFNAPIASGLCFVRVSNEDGTIESKNIIKGKEQIVRIKKSSTNLLVAFCF